MVLRKQDFFARKRYLYKWEFVSKGAAEENIGMDSPLFTRELK